MALNLPHVVGVRMSADDTAKLNQLCLATQRTASEVVRLLIRLAQPTHFPELRITGADGEIESTGAVHGEE